MLKFYFLQAGEGIGDDDAELTQTLMELDFETCVDGDELDEFETFKGVLQGGS